MGLRANYVKIFLGFWISRYLGLVFFSISSFFLFYHTLLMYEHLEKIQFQIYLFTRWILISIFFWRFRFIFSTLFQTLWINSLNQKRGSKVEQIGFFFNKDLVKTVEEEKRIKMSKNAHFTLVNTPQLKCQKLCILNRVQNLQICQHISLCFCYQGAVCI